MEMDCLFLNSISFLFGDQGCVNMDVWMSLLYVIGNILVVLCSGVLLPLITVRVFQKRGGYRSITFIFLLTLLVVTAILYAIKLHEYLNNCPYDFLDEETVMPLMFADISTSISISAFTYVIWRNMKFAIEIKSLTFYNGLTKGIKKLELENATLLSRVSSLIDDKTILEMEVVRQEVKNRIAEMATFVEGEVMGENVEHWQYPIHYDKWTLCPGGVARHIGIMPNQDSTVVYMETLPGGPLRMKSHNHIANLESITVIEGKCKMIIGGKTKKGHQRYGKEKILMAGDSIKINKGIFHDFEAQDCKLIVVWKPRFESALSGEESLDASLK
jgi:quercetin dioxygenase-like cupin family protein